MQIVATGSKKSKGLKRSSSWLVVLPILTSTFHQYSTDAQSMTMLFRRWTAKGLLSKFNILPLINPNVPQASGQFGTLSHPDTILTIIQNQLQEILLSFCFASKITSWQFITLLRLTVKGNFQ